jgi:lysophospholipase L1-like esterase
MRLKRLLVIAYLIVLHVVVVAALFKTDLLPRLAIRAGLAKPDIPDMEPIISGWRGFHKKIDSFIPPGTTIFLGDSIMSGLTTTDLAPRAVNYGIGWQRSDQLIKSMDSYESVKRAGRVVLMIGTNDLLQGRDDELELRYRSILEKIPPGIPVVMSSVTPLSPNIVWLERKIQDTKVRAAVQVAKKVCESRHGCKFVNAYEVLSNANGGVQSDVLLEDGIHLTSKGYTLWSNALHQAIESSF